VDGLRHYLCPECGADFFDGEQSRHNLGAIQAALNEEPRFVSGLSIREWRDRIGLTQRVAARLFGGGLNAFSKYESGEIVHSEPMDNLLWLAMRRPEIILDLAHRHHVKLPTSLAAECIRHSFRTWSASIHMGPPAGSGELAAPRAISIVERRHADFDA